MKKKQFIKIETESEYIHTYPQTHSFNIMKILHGQKYAVLKFVRDKK